MTSRVTPLCCHHSVEKCKQSTKLFTPNLTIINFICLWHITLVTSLNYCKLSCAKTLNRVFHGFTIYTKSIPKVFNRIWCPIDAVLYVPRLGKCFFAVTLNCNHSIPHIYPTYCLVYLFYVCRVIMRKFLICIHKFSKTENM